MTLLRTTIECAISEHEQGRKNAVADRLSIASIEAAKLEERLAAATERAERANCPIPDRYACQRCGRRDGLDAVVPNFIWERLSARAGGVNILCLWCMDELAAEEGIDGATALHFAGRALYGGSDIRFAECVEVATRSAKKRAEKAELAAANAEEGREHALRHLTEVERERDALKKLVEEAMLLVGDTARLADSMSLCDKSEAWLARAKEALKDG